MADDYSSDSTRTGLLVPGSQATGTFETAGDKDWFKVSLSADKFYTFELSGGAGVNTSYTSLTAYNAQSSYITSASGGYSSGVSLTIKASVTGDYYIAAGDSHYDAIASTAYTIKAGAAVADDAGDTRATAIALPLDQKVRAAFQSSSDVDYFKIPVVAGKTYTVTPAWNPDGGSGYGSLRVEDSSGNSISSNSGSGITSFTAASTGNYYVATSSYYSGSASAYTLTFSAAQDDYSANQSGAGTLMPGSSLTGSFEVSGDKDWFSTYLTAGTTYWFTLGSASGSGAYSSYATLNLLDTDGATLATSGSSYSYVSSSNSLLLQYVPAKSGVYYVETVASNYSSGRYTVSAALGEADDVGDTTATASALAIGTAQSGRLAISSDRDVYKISVKAGSVYLVELTAKDIVNSAQPSLSGSTGDGYYGNGVATYSKPGAAGYMVYTPSTSGDFYLTVSNSNSYQNGSAGYTLKVSEPAVDDYAADATTTGALDVGSKVTGKIDYTGDVDWIKVTLQYGVKYAFQLRGAGSGEGTLSLDNGSNLSLTAGQQYNSVYLNTQGDGIYTLTTTTGGDYYLAVRGNTSSYNNTSDGTGSYTIYATALSGDTTAPTVKSYTPSENAGMYDNIVVQFNESIMRGNGNNYITLRDSLGAAVESYYGSDSHISITGNTLTINPGTTLKPGTKYLLDIPAGSITDLAGNKYAGGALLGVNTVSTVSTGGAGNDYLVGLGNGLKLDGGAGVDTAIYGNYRSYFQVAHTTADTTVQNANSGATAGDTLTGIERLMFTDTNVALDIDGAGGQAYRLYQAAFNRTPDKAGVGYWIAQIDKGASLHDVAQSFIDSTEFRTLYGASSTDAAFVNSLYQNVLHRAGEQAGVDYWNGVLAKGASRADVLASFSEGAENQAAVLKVIGNGFDYTPYG